jgi:hypothetical protein
MANSWTGSGSMQLKPISRTADIISHGVWLYFRFCLS